MTFEEGYRQLKIPEYDDFSKLLINLSKNESSTDEIIYHYYDLKKDEINIIDEDIFKIN